MRRLTWTHNKGYKNRDILVTLKHRVEQGAIKHHPMVEAQKYFPATPTFRMRKVEKIELKEDKIRLEYYATFPDELKKTLKLFPGVGMWYEDPSDVWCFKQADIMKEHDLTFQQGWDIMMYNYRKDLHRERLAKQYQLQQLQEEGVQITPELPSGSEDYLKKSREITQLIEEDTHNDQLADVWLSVLFRLYPDNPQDPDSLPIRPITDAPMIEEAQYPCMQKIRFDDPDCRHLSQDAVIDFIDLYPNLDYVFHHEWFTDSKYLAQMLPMTEQQKLEFDLSSELQSRELEEQKEFEGPESEDNPEFRKYMKKLILEEEKNRDALSLPNYPLPYMSFLEEQNYDATAPMTNSDVADIFSELGFSDLKRMLEIDAVEKEKALADLHMMEKEFDDIIDSLGPKTE